jgi:phage terminase small subunit
METMMGHIEIAVMETAESVIDLASKHVQLKVQISAMQAELDEVNRQLADQLEHPADGSKTHKVENMKVKVTGRLNRSLDRDVWNQIKNNFNPDLRPVKDSLDESAWKKLQKENPEVAARIAPAIKESPGKPGIEISF